MKFGEVVLWSGIVSFGTGVVDMGRMAVRWLVVGLVAVAVFAVTVWVGQVLLLPRFVLGEADRWVVSAAAGTVLGGLVGVWAGAWVKPASEGCGEAATAPGSSIRVEGGVGGIVSLGDRTVNRQHRSAADVPAPAPLGGSLAGPDVNAPQPGAEGSARAARAARSVDVGGDVGGIVSVGDDTSNTQLP